MKPLRVVNLVLLCAVLTGGLTAQPAWMRTQTAYDCSTATGLPQTECEALVAFYSATGGDTWYTKTGWLQTTTPCTWYGVTCAEERVTRLYLSGNNLRGALPPEIGNLAVLTSLDVGYTDGSYTGGSSWYNAITALPPEIGNLTALTALDLSYNALTVLPPEIGALAALDELDLSGNALTVLLPEIGNLTALTALDLSYNALTVLLPEIGNLTALTKLDLSGNALTALPPEIGNLTGLGELYLSGNALTVLLPEIGNFTVLERLDLNGNALTALPPEIGSLAVLGRLDLSSNALTALPTEIGNLSALKYLYLSYNDLTVLPTEIGNFSALKYLYLNGNDLTALPPEIGNLIGLLVLHLNSNALTALPPEIGNLATLGYLDLSDNALTTLPPEIGNLVALGYLDLSNNALTALPQEIGSLSGLLRLYLNNALAVLPPEIGNLPAVEYLYLSNNALTTLPPEIGNLATLVYLDLSSNALTVLLPEINTLTKLRVLNLNNNALTTLPPEIGNLTVLRGLGLSDNALTALPLEISNLAVLSILYVNDNPLSGAVPEMLTALTLDRFDFYNTAWCIPETGPVSTWLAGIYDVYGTGQVCGQSPGSLHGTVTLSHTDPAAGVQVNLYRPIRRLTDQPYEWSYVTTTHTLADGTYQFDGLGQGIDYRVEFIAPMHVYAPQYYDNQPTREQSTPVTVTLGMTRTGIDATLSPAVLKSATPAGAIFNGSTLVYQLLVHTDITTTLRLYDPLDSHLTWQGFVGEAPGTLTYASGALTGTVDLLAFTPITVAFTVRVDLPPESFINEYAQVSNTAYYAFPDETMLLAHPSNTQVNIVRDVIARIFLPLVLRSF